MYNEMLRRLIDLPEAEKELAAGVYVFTDGHCGCVIGKQLSPSLRGRLGGTRENSLWVRQLGDGYLLGHEMLAELSTLQAERSEIAAAQNANDDFRLPGRLDKNNPDVRKARYAYMVKWLGDKIAAA